MRIQRKWILVFLSSFCLLPAGQAQPSAKQRVLEVIQALSDRYRNAAGLSFSLSYKYASEDKPGVYLDSLHGSFKMSGSRYWYALDSTEFIGSADLSVILFKEDRVIYLARPSAALQSANPLALLDSFLLKNDGVEYRVEEMKGEQKITMTFKPGMTVKRMEYYIDRRSGLVTKMINIVQARQLYDPSVRSLVEGNASYAVVETDFMNYREGSIEARQLDLTTYFKKEGKEYVTVAPYESYKIFLGTPDL